MTRTNTILCYKTFKNALVAGALCMATYAANAQTCANPDGIAYGLNGSGFIFPINTTTGVVSSAINPAYSGNSPSQSNALGYNNLNGKFYYFKRNANVTKQEFVSFDPATNTVSILLDCPTTNVIYTGCASANGAGFYAMDSQANLYYYKISNNTWTKITSTFYDQYGFNITTTLQSLSGGDIAIDGNGTLWILCSSGTKYGLYKVVGVVPTSAISSITCSVYVPPTTSTPGSAAFAGIAFTSTGQILLTTLQGDDKLYKLQNTLTLTYINTLSASGAGTDLTSCNYPLMVLPSDWKQVDLYRSRQDIVIKWVVAQHVHEANFVVEKSVDGQQWQAVSTIPGQAWAGTDRNYSTTLLSATEQSYMVRIKMVEQDGHIQYSPIRNLQAISVDQGRVWPNPTKNLLLFEPLRQDAVHQVQIFDITGKILIDQKNEAGDHQINVNGLQPGTYQIRISNRQGGDYRKIFVKA